MIVDRTTLLVLGFNYTLLDITKSRSFGVVTKNRKTVQDAIKLFEADCARQPYVAAGSLLVSPENARAQLSAFLSNPNDFDGQVCSARQSDATRCNSRATRFRESLETGREPFGRRTASNTAAPLASGRVAVKVIER